MRIEPYATRYRNRWDDFVSSSANGTFLHRRGYMDYHADRFSDCSLMIEDEKSGRLLAILPANREGSALVSHRGLTYGGLIVARRHVPDTAIGEIFDVIIDWCKANGIDRLLYRPVPHIYHRYPSEADVYALWLRGAEVSNLSPSSAIPLDKPVMSNESMRQAARKASASGLRAQFSTDIPSFHLILTERLMSRHNTTPVHSLQELQLLADRFPDNIRLMAVYDGKEMVGGILLYITDTTIHAQYIATTDAGRRGGAIPLAVTTICGEFSGKQWKYFDFGTSIDPATSLINRGLSGQKYSLGGRPTLYTQLTLAL